MENKLAIMQELAKLYGFEVTEVAPGEGGIYSCDGDKERKVSLSEILEIFNCEFKNDFYKSKITIPYAVNNKKENSKRESCVGKVESFKLNGCLANTYDVSDYNLDAKKDKGQYQRCPNFHSAA